MSEGDGGERERSSRWRRRDERREAERNQLQKHGAALRTVYRDAVLKRMRAKKKRK